MSVKYFELIHGAVLTKLLRNDKPITLKLVERAENDPWAAYRVNEECYLYIKYRTTFRTDPYRDVIPIFDFLVSKGEVEKIKQLPKKYPTYYALVCAPENSGPKNMNICFLDPEQIKSLSSNGNAESFSISVWTEEGKSLRAKSKFVEKPFIVSRNRLDNWEAPGS